MVFAAAYAAAWVLCGIRSGGRLRRENVSVYAERGLCCDFCIAAINATEIYTGYAENGVVHRYNDAVMRDASEKLQNGERVQELFLKTLPNAVCTGVMPYDEGVQSMKYWIDYYYGTAYETKWYYSADGAEKNVELYTELGDGIYVTD